VSVPESERGGSGAQVEPVLRFLSKPGESSQRASIPPVQRHRDSDRDILCSVAVGVANE
jgi:hypothetical protein